MLILVRTLLVTLKRFNIKMTKITTSTYMVIISLLCVIVYLLGALDANKAVAEKSLWECENPDRKKTRDEYNNNG